MSMRPEFRCNFHGMALCVSGEEAACSALAKRFRQLPSASGCSTELQFHYDAITFPKRHRLRRPPFAGRPFYQPEQGEATYFPERDLCYIDYEDRVRVLCHASEGKCCISSSRQDGEDLWLETQPLFTIPLMEMLKRRGLFALHAAAFAKNGKCLLVPGSSGSGKSTLTVALLRAGLDFLSDDMVVLRRNGVLEILAIPEDIHITKQTASFFPELKRAIDKYPQRSSGKLQVDATELYSAMIAWDAIPKAIVLPTVSHIEESILIPVDQQEIFSGLIKSVLLTEPISTRAELKALSELSSSVPGYRLYAGRDFDHTATSLLELLV